MTHPKGFEEGKVIFVPDNPVTRALQVDEKSAVGRPAAVLRMINDETVEIEVGQKSFRVAVKDLLEGGQSAS